MKRVWLLALAVVVVLPCHILAAPIVFTSSGSAAGFAMLDGTASPSISVAQAPITTSWAIGDAETAGDSTVSANLSSTVTDNSVTAIGIFQLTRGSNSFAAIGGEYELTFALAEPMAYQLLLWGTAFQDNSQSGPSNITAWFLGDDVFYHDSFSGPGMLNAPPTGILSAGDYRVLISFQGTSIAMPRSGPAGTVSGSMNFSLELAPVAVPEPASILLLAAGLAAVGRRRYVGRKCR